MAGDTPLQTAAAAAPAPTTRRLRPTTCVNPFNPCLPDRYSRTCQRHPMIGARLRAVQDQLAAARPQLSRLSSECSRARTVCGPSVVLGRRGGALERDVELGPAGERLQHDAVALGELEQRGELLVVGVGVELEAQADVARSRPAPRGRRRACRGSRGRPRRARGRRRPAMPRRGARPRRASRPRRRRAPRAACRPSTAACRRRRWRGAGRRRRSPGPVSTEQETPSPSVPVGLQRDQRLVRVVLVRLSSAAPAAPSVRLGPWLEGKRPGLLGRGRGRTRGAAPRCCEREARALVDAAGGVQDVVGPQRQRAVAACAWRARSPRRRAGCRGRGRGRAARPAACAAWRSCASCRGRTGRRRRGGRRARRSRRGRAPGRSRPRCRATRRSKLSSQPYSRA